MTRKFKLIMLAVGLVVILIAALATTSLAAQKTRSTITIPTDADYTAWGCPMLNGNYQVVADLLGMTPQEIQAELQQGKSLVEIAAAKGVTEDQLVAAIFEPMKTFMQGQVTAGNWTQAQMDAHLSQAEQHIRLLVNASGNGYGGYGCGIMGGLNGTSGNRAGFFRGGMMGGWGNNTVNRGAFGRGMMGGWY